MNKISAVKQAYITPGRYKRTIVVLIAAWLIMMALLVACNSGSSKPAQAPPSATPAPDGATLLETRCSACHSADKPKQARKTRDQWEQTVTDMIGKGAQLTEAEKKVLVDYLANTYKH
ncbi:MAG: hypothetical protein V2A78_13705 [bacterium]